MIEEQHEILIDESSLSEAIAPENPLPIPTALETMKLFWDRRLLLWSVTCVSTIMWLGIAFLVPNEYEATARLMPPGSTSGATAMMGMAMNSGGTEGAGGAASVMGGMGGLASQLLWLSNQSDLIVGVLSGDTVNTRIIDRFDLMHRYKISKYREDCLKKLDQNTDFEVDHKNNIITIMVRDRDPKTAAEMANAYVEEVNNTLARTNTSAASKERVFLEERVKQADSDLTTDSQRFSEFSSKNTAINLPDQAKAMLEGAAALQGQLIAAEAQLSSIKAQYTTKNYRVVQAEAQVQELRSQLKKLGGVDQGSGMEKFDEVYPSIRQLPLLSVQYMQLYRKLKIDEAVYGLLTRELEGARIVEAQTTPTVEVLDPAMVPQKKYSPHRGTLAIIGAFLGFAGTLLVLFGRRIWQDMSDDDDRKQFIRSITQPILSSWPLRKIFHTPDISWTKN
jgi:capsule polysaccharide export protein KpsE/RkpR